MQIAAVLAAMAFAASAHAESPREELAHAHRLLAKANHDYGGHRIKAMEELRHAGEALHLHLGGDLREQERQWDSDRLVREARTLTAHARDTLEHEDRDRVVTRLDKAIEEMDKALHVR